MAVFAKPRLVTLLEVASRAELLRRKRQVRGVAFRAAFGAAALVLALLLLGALHAVAWAALARPLRPVGAALAVGAFDLVLVAALGALAARNRAGPEADEAVAVRNTALRGAELELRTLGGLLRVPEEEAPPVAGRRVGVYPPP